MDEITQSRRWCMTINNPAETDEEMQKYIEGLEHIKYAIFSREKGHETGTEHFQMFLIFSIGKRFSTIKNYFPTAHIEKAEGSNVQARDYCLKSDTHVSGPYEIGQFAEERGRTDIKSFYELIDAGASDFELRELFPKLYLRELNKLPELRMTRNSIYLKQKRDIEVTFVYGPSGSGKSTYVDSLVENETYFYVDTFDNSAFTGYAGENVLILDEFKGRGQFTIQFMNRLLDCFPIKLRGLRSLLPACFTKVYIISNFSYKDLYKDEQEENRGQYNGFVRRLNKIIRIDSGFNVHVERETIWEEIPENERKVNGRHLRAKQVIEYDKFGCSKIIFDKDLHVQQQLELTEIEDDDLPF